jgi:hypothetical protein
MISPETSVPLVVLV